MKININGDGTFVCSLSNDDICKGLPPYLRLHRNEGYMRDCDDVYEADFLLHPIPEYFRSLSFKNDSLFPYPQIFSNDHLSILCTATQIYELVAGKYVLKHEVSMPASEWSIMMSYELCILSNGKCVIQRDAVSKKYSDITDNFPSFMCIENYGDQLIIGSPNGGYN